MVRWSVSQLAAAVALGVVCCLVRPAGVSAVSVAQACEEVSCFSGVVASCGSCFPTQAPTFCKSPCQASWGSLDVITCLGQGGNNYWLNNVQSLNVKCGLPPIPNAAAATAVDGGLGGIAAPATAIAAAPLASATPATVAVSTAPAQSLSGGVGAPATEAAAAATPATVGAGSGVASTAATPATVGVGSGVASTAATPVAGTAPVGTAAAVATPVDTTTAASAAAANAAASGANPQATTGGAGTTGTAIATTGAVSSAIGAFGCAASAARLNMATASQCVMSITNSNACTQPCAAQFALFAPACRNTMAQDSFYGDTWQGVFTACRITYSVNGPVVADTAASIAGGPVVATAATTATATSAGTDPLLTAAAPVADQAAFSSVVFGTLPLLLVAAAVLLLL